MYISNLVIKNYRTFRDFTIKLKPLTLIIGENNVGKSNLLDSIGLIFSQDVSYFKRRMLEVDDFNYEVIRELKRRIFDVLIPVDQIVYPEIIIEATLTDWNSDQGAVIADWYTDNTYRSVTLTYVFAPISRFDAVAEITLQREFLQKKREEEAGTFDALPENIRLDLINFPISKYHYTIYGGPRDNNTAVNAYYLNQLKFELLDALRDACSELVASHSSKLLFRILDSKDENAYQDLKAQLVGLQGAIASNAALQQIKAGISVQLEKISLADDNTTNLVDLIFSMPNVSDLLKKISIVYGDNPIKIDRNGTGRNNLLFISLVLSYIEDVTSTQAIYFRVVGLEEPESHLHPNLQDHLAHNIELLIKEPGSDNYRKDIQLLITSHSTHITTKINFDNTVVLFRGTNDVIHSHYILDGFDQRALAKKQIRYLNKYLDAVNTNLFYSRKVILVEGISEKLLVPVFFKIINGHSPEKSSCCVISVNGLAFSYFLEIIKNGYFQRCVVLTDSDTGTKTEERAANLAQKYQPNPQINIAFTQLATFEMDLIQSNNTGTGRDILLEVLKQVRPNSGAAYETALGTGPITVEGFFPLIEEFKSEFSYALLLRLDQDHTGFTVPQYIVNGINHLA